MFRLVLSLLVVASHVGGMGSTPAGGTAVASFFAISGFLMARTITENYRGNGFMRFYLNRIIRLVPPLLVAVVLTALVLWMRDSRGFEIKQHAVERYMPVELPSSLATLIDWNPFGFPIYVSPDFRLVPQAWSLLVEAAFYLVAPLIVLLAERKRTALVWIAAAISFALSVEAARVHFNWMRSPVTTLWMFLLGMQTYFFARTNTWDHALAARARKWAVIPLVLVVAISIRRTTFPPDVMYMLAPWLVGCWLVAGQWHSRRSDRIDHALGNLSYGVFLGHFLGILVMYWVAEIAYRTTGVFGVFGVPDTSTEPLLFMSAYAFALIVGVALHYAVERPMDRLRASVRRKHTIDLAPTGVVTATN